MNPSHPEGEPMKESNEIREYEERRELGKANVDSGELMLVDPAYLTLEEYPLAAEKLTPEERLEEARRVLDERAIHVPTGGDGTWKIIGTYKITETPIPKEHGGMVAKHQELIRLEFETEPSSPEIKE